MTDPVLDAYRATQTFAEPFADLVGTERYFNAACEAGEVSPLTLDRRDLPWAPEDEAARIVAVRDRLRRLGYPLGDVSETMRGQWTDDVREALKQFQREAMLLAHDGELTVESWDALQELFNFETPLRVEDWFGPEGADRPLQRATRLRLSVLGFGRPPTIDSWQPTTDALTEFVETLVSIGILNTSLAPVLDPAMAVLVFAHDRLAERLTNCGDQLAALRGGAKKQAEHLLVCFAKIELWLHGYDVAPDGRSDLVLPAMHGRHGGMKTNRTNRTADQFNLFFADSAPEGMRVYSAPPEAIPARVPEMLRRMRELRARDAWRREDASHEIVRMLEERLEESPSLWNELKTAATKLAGILFDGVRRVIAWIGRLFRRIGAAVSTAAVNMWRAVHHFMGGAAFYFRKATRALAEGVAFLIAPGHRSEPVGCSGYCRRIDFDAGVLVDDEAEPDEVRRFARGLERKGRSLAIACRIIRLVSTAVRLAAAGAAGLAGGFVPMVLGLASVWSQVRKLGRMLDALEEAG